MGLSLTVVFTLTLFELHYTNRYDRMFNNNQTIFVAKRGDKTALILTLKCIIKP